MTWTSSLLPSNPVPSVYDLSLLYSPPGPDTHETSAGDDQVSLMTSVNHFIGNGPAPCPQCLRLCSLCLKDGYVVMVLSFSAIPQPFETGVGDSFTAGLKHILIHAILV